MANQGWIKLHRSITETDIWFAEPFSPAMAFIDLLLRANHKDAWWKSKRILRGQLWTSKNMLEQRWRVGHVRVNKILNMLASEEMIAVEYHSMGVLITVLNYDKYQSTSSIQTNSQPKLQTNSQPKLQTNSQPTNNNDKKCIKNEEEKGRRPHFRDPNSFED